MAAVEVSCSAASGYQLNVSGFKAALRRSSTGPASLRYTYSTDGGTTWVTQGSNQTNPSASCNAGSTLSWSTTLAVAYPNTLKFRIFGFNASSTTGTEQIENLTISGTVTAISGCTAPTLTLTPTNVSCNGGSTGTITLTTSGGTSPFTYRWNNGATTQNLSALTAATYTVTVTANGGCSVTASKAVTQPAALSISTTQTNTTCGTNNGTATAAVTGGTSPYTYAWGTSPAQTAITATGLGNGTYGVTVTDHNLCKASTAVTIALLAPSGLSATAITTTSATLNWSAVSGALSYNIQYRKTGTATWTSATASTNSLAVASLVAATTYEFQIQMVCSSGTSAFTASTNFTTLSPCSTPVNLVASQITGTSALLSWGAVSGASSYNIQHRVTGTTSWTTTSSTSASATILGLTPSTSYDCQVQTVCSGGSSSFSSTLSFTTNSNTSSCDSTLWNHVYNSYRLIVNEQCTYATGTVAKLIYEADGDIHIRLSVDSAFTCMFNAFNTSGESGDLVCEPVCATTVTQTDAISSCVNFSNTVYIPNVGEHVKVTGSYVTDNDHGWNELHPVTSIVITTQTQVPLLQGLSNQADNGLAMNVFPIPASDYVYFKLNMQPTSPVFLTISDGIGRSAGQYQMLENTKLEVTTSYLPAGIYYYNMEQAGHLLQSGKFLVVH